MSRKKSDFNDTMHKAQASMLKHALLIAENSKFTLDYSDRSIESLDNLLVSIADEVRRGGLTTQAQITQNDGVKGISESLGSYIAECAERKLGAGVWTDRDPKTGEATLALTLRNGATIFPMEWVMKKLLDPEHYSVKEAYTTYTTS